MKSEECQHEWESIIKTVNYDSFKHHRHDLICKKCEKIADKEEYDDYIDRIMYRS